MAEQEQPDVMKMVSSFLPLIIIYLWGRLGLDTEDPIVLWSVRGLFALSQAIQLGLVHLLQQRITERSSDPQHSKVIKYVIRRPQQPFAAQDATAEPFEYAEKTVSQYDMEQTVSLKAWTPLLITLAIHLYFGAVQPLIIQIFTGPLRLFENKVFKMYFLGAQFDRPFPAEAAGMLAQLTGQKSEKEQMDEWDQQQQSKGGKKVKAVESKKDKQEAIESKKQD